MFAAACLVLSAPAWADIPNATPGPSGVYSVSAASPARGPDWRIHFSLGATAGALRLYVYDAAGRIRDVVRLGGELQAGQRDIVVPMGSLPSGVYFLALAVGSYEPKAATRVVVVR